jgi:hypothetical protein
MLTAVGFTIAWRYDEEGRTRVAQVDRGSCALIFSDQWAQKVGKGLTFISLNVGPEGDWGYRVLIVEDLDGNQLFFNYPNEPEQHRE